MVLAGAALGFAMTGCGGNSSSSSSTSTAGQAIQYFGTQNPDQSSQGGFPIGGVWSITLDTQNSFFSYSNIESSDNRSVFSSSGSIAASKSGILDLTLSGGAAGSGGYAVHIPGEGLLLRAGDNHKLVVGATVSNACPSLTSQKTFNFVSLASSDSRDLTPHVAYGSIQINPGTAGTWSFSNLNMYLLDGGSLSPTPFPDGSCASTKEGFVIAVPLSGVAQQTTPSQITVGISPSGLLVIDQGQNSGWAARNPTGPTGPLGLLGVIQPTAALNVADLVTKSYAGFETEAYGPLGTIAVAFGATPGTSTSITGGGFPNDDITQLPAADTTVDLGSQSSQTPGLFTSVTLTRPDSFGLCAGTASGGTDAKGNATCVFHGAAVVGQVAGKYVIFANIVDPTLAAIQIGDFATTPLTVLNLLLYQQ
jgi:hypothetical protein